MDLKSHWENVYVQKQPSEVSWYQPHLSISLSLLAKAGLNPSSRVIDVGGGVSTLVDDMLAQGVGDITVLDLAGQALAVSKARLEEKAKAVQWVEGDITRVALPQSRYDLWHDRAVFHFLTQPEDRRRYVEVLRGALVPGGQVVIATSSLDGPPRCSNLDVIRCSPDTLQAELGSEFKLLDSQEEAHQTPLNRVQRFIYCRFRRSG